QAPSGGDEQTTMCSARFTAAITGTEVIFHGVYRYVNEWYGVVFLPVPVRTQTEDAFKREGSPSL
ncbi:hypothetical protein, partial [Citrobacter sp. VF227]